MLQPSVPFVEPPQPDRRLWLAAVGAVMLAVLLLDFRWIDANGLLPMNDEASHMYEALGVGPHHPGYAYPPLVLIVTRFTMDVFGASIATALRSLSVFLLLYVASMAWLGAITSGGRGALVLAVAAAGSPWIFTFSHLYLLDLPLASMIAFCFACLVASDGYRRPIPCILLGLGMAAGMLIKWTFLIQYPAMGLLALIPSWRLSPPRARMVVLCAVGETAMTFFFLWWSAHDAAPAITRLALTSVFIGWSALLWFAWMQRRQGASGGWNGACGFVVSLSLAMLLGLPWYASHLTDILVYTGKLGDDLGTVGVMGKVHHMGFVAYQAWSMISRSWWLMVGWLAVGAVMCWRAPTLRWPAVIAFCGWIAALAALAAIHPVLVIPQPRYVLPFLPMLTFIAFGWIATFRRAWIPAVVAMAVVGSLQVGWWLALRPPVPWIAELDLLGRVCLNGTVTDPTYGPATALDRLPTFILPGTKAPVPRSHPLVEALQLASQRGCKLVAVGRPSQIEDPVRPETVELLCGMNGLPMRVGWFPECLDEMPAESIQAVLSCNDTYESMSGLIARLKLAPVRQWELDRGVRLILWMPGP